MQKNNHNFCWWIVIIQNLALLHWSNISVVWTLAISRLLHSSLMCTSPEMWFFPPVSPTAVIGPLYLSSIPAFPISVPASTSREIDKYKCFNLYLNNSIACRWKNHGKPFNKYRFHKHTSVGVLMRPTVYVHVWHKQKSKNHIKINIGWSTNDCRCVDR